MPFLARTNAFSQSKKSIVKTNVIYKSITKTGSYIGSQGNTRSSAIAERPRCTLFKPWLNISAKSVHVTVLYVRVDVDESSFYCSTAPCLYLMQN